MDRPTFTILKSHSTQAQEGLRHDFERHTRINTVYTPHLHHSHTIQSVRTVSANLKVQTVSIGLDRTRQDWQTG